jgi:hypothetical protein
MEPVVVFSSVLALYTKLKDQYQLMDVNKKNWNFLMENVFCYEALLRDKIEACKTKEGQRLFGGPIKLFYEGIQGFEVFFESHSKRKGFLGKVYGFCSELCDSSKNREKIVDASRKIAHAAALLNFTGITAVESQQKETQIKIAEMMEKVILMFDQQSQLKNQLDQVLHDGGTEEEVVNKLSDILDVPVGRIRDDTL